MKSSPGCCLKKKEMVPSKASRLLGIVLQFIISFLLMTFSFLGKLLLQRLKTFRLAWISIVDGLSWSMLLNPPFISQKNTWPSLYVAISRVIPYSTNPSNNLYLGLPILMGNSKKRAFQGILDKVLGRIEGWRAKTLSQVGKLVLIKSAEAALPSYAMSSFLLPVNFCTTLDRIFKNF